MSICQNNLSKNGNIKDLSLKPLVEISGLLEDQGIIYICSNFISFYPFRMVMVRSKMKNCEVFSKTYSNWLNAITIQPIWKILKTRFWKDAILIVMARLIKKNWPWFYWLWLNKAQRTEEHVLFLFCIIEGILCI